MSFFFPFQQSFLKLKSEKQPGNRPPITHTTTRNPNNQKSRKKIRVDLEFSVSYWGACRLL
jgi:hypothetical protein